MKITVLYATNKKQTSSTYQLAQTAIQELSQGDDVYEFSLLTEMKHFCSGCFSCFNGYPEKCKNYPYLIPIKQAMKASDLIVFACPVYVYHVPGQVKTFLDHCAYEWMMHRPDPVMFHKQALIISTAAGGGTDSTVKDITDSLTFWGVSHIYSYQKSVYRENWTDIESSLQEKYRSDVQKVCQRIQKESTHLNVSLKVKQYFYLFRALHQKGRFLKADNAYWKASGWLEKKRPWKE